MELYIWYVIKIKDKPAYLGDGIGDSCKWTDRENAIWFEYRDQAEKFAKNYFKNFTNYEIQEFEDYM